MHYEFTGEVNDFGLRRIRATIDLPQHGVKAGDLGGWIQVTENLQGTAWVFDNAWVHGNAVVSGNAQVHGDAVVSGSARVFGSAVVQDFAEVSSNAWVLGNTVVDGNAWVSSIAQLTQPDHILTLDDVGSEDVTVTLFRTNTGHELRVGCWTGTLETLMAEVQRRSEIHGDWQEKWTIQYQDILAQGQQLVESW